MSAERTFELAFPEIAWAKPLPIRVGTLTRFCCRYCIGLHGPKAAELEARGFVTKAECVAHIVSEHAGDHQAEKWDGL